MPSGISRTAPSSCSRSTAAFTSTSFKRVTTTSVHVASRPGPASSSAARLTSSPTRRWRSRRTSSPSECRVVCLRTRYSAGSGTRPASPRLPLEDDDGRRDAGVVREREVHGGHAEGGGARLDGAAHGEHGAPRGLRDDLGVVPVHVAGGTEGLGESLLGCEAGGEGGR